MFHQSQVFFSQIREAFRSHRKIFICRIHIHAQTVSKAPFPFLTSFKNSATMSAILDPTMLLSSLVAAKLIPSPLIPENFKPTVHLSVTFGHSQVTAGNLFRASDCKVAPAVSFTAEVQYPPFRYYRASNEHRKIPERTQRTLSCSLTPTRRRQMTPSSHIGVIGS